MDCITITHTCEMHPPSKLAILSKLDNHLVSLIVQEMPVQLLRISTLELDIPYRREWEHLVEQELGSTLWQCSSTCNLMLIFQHLQLHLDRLKSQQASQQELFNSMLQINQSQVHSPTESNG